MLCVYVRVYVFTCVMCVYTYTYVYDTIEYLFLQNACSIADIVLFSTLYPVLTEESRLYKGELYHHQAMHTADNKKQ